MAPRKPQSDQPASTRTEERAALGPLSESQKESRCRRSKAPISPDYYTRLVRGIPQAFAFRHGVRPGRLADEILDLEAVTRMLGGVREEPETPVGDVDLALRLQGSVMAVQFLEGFEGL